ncbi:TonB-dependent receptor [Brevundimonas sp. LM2]|uniref:TonB-dependent siderophore receptor n=1 Tax=Brevundimonas sp. LM2 TaxID=1938605 RepID=UPI00155883AF|nr:TonB-dependent receptor [Brevundimonas sp. LM2]
MTVRTTRQATLARRLARALGGVSLLALATAVPVAALAQDATVAFDVPAGPLAPALARYADAAGVQLLYPSDLADGRRTAGLRGRFAPEAGLAQLLAGTGLTYRFVDPRTAQIEVVVTGSVDGERVLGPVRIEGAQGTALAGATAVNGINGSRDVTATEGTGSYTSGALTIASKTPTSLKDIPQSVSVITSQRLEEQNVRDFTEALGQAPGITLTQGLTSLQTEFYSRGFRLNTFQIDGGAPLSLDFNYFPQIDLAQYDHVEVLRGAATYFNGYGDPSGTVNLVRKKPLDHAQVLVEAQAGSWDTYRVTVDATSPLAMNGRLRGRAVLSYQDNEHFYELAKDNKTLVYGVLEYDLTSSTLIRGGVSYTRQDSLPWYGGLPRFQSGADLRLPRESCLCFSWNRWDFDTTEIFGAVEQKLGDQWSANISITSIQQNSMQKVGYSSGSVNPITRLGPTINGTYQDFSSEQLSAQMTLSGRFNLLGHEQEITFGINHADWDGGGQLAYGSLFFGTAASPYRPFPGGPAYYFGSPNGSAPPINVFDFNADDPRYSEPANTLPSFRIPVSGRTQSGAYVAFRFTPLERLHVSTGLQYSRFEQESVRETLCVNPLPASCGGARIGEPIAVQRDASKDDDVSLPSSLSVSYDLRPDFSVYVGYSNVDESQANRFDGNSEPIDPITGSNLETGLKWQGRNGRLNASVAAYRIEKEGFSVFDDASGVVDPDGSFYAVDNQGRRYRDAIVSPGVTCCYIGGLDLTLISQGLGAEVGGQVAEGWEIAAGYTFNENEYNGEDTLRYFSRSQGDPIASFQPKHLLKVWTSYQFPSSSPLNALSLMAGVYAQSDAYRAGTACAQLLAPDPLGISRCAPGQTIPFSYTQPAYSVWSLGAEYKLGPAWEFAVNVDNLFDEHYYRTTGGVAGGNWYGEPRNITVSLRGRF